MDKIEQSEITRILDEWNKGDERAVERLLPFVYDELKRQARIFMARERTMHTLQPTALVHEAFLKLSKQPDLKFENRKHFYGIAARLMRQVLVDHARSHSRKKRRGAKIHLSTEDLQIPFEERASSILALNEALERLAEFDVRQCKIVEMKFFGGLTENEIANALEISSRTVTRDWKIARLWLYKEINSETS